MGSSTLALPSGDKVIRRNFGCFDLQRQVRVHGHTYEVERLSNNDGYQGVGRYSIFKDMTQ